MKPLFFLLFALLVGSGAATAQSVRLEPADPIERMVYAHISVHENTLLKGWSIQLLVTEDAVKANNAKVQFLRRFPDIKANLHWEAPYHRLQVGAFVNQNDANLLLKRLAPDYPGAYLIINNNIKARDLMESPF
jgi:hypothetical protein